jgi:hypothetical protein
MTEVTLSQGVALVLLFAVCGHVRPIDGSGRHNWGVPVAHRLARGLHVSLRRGESKPWGSGAFDDAMRGLGEVEGCRPRRPSRPRPLHKAQAGWSLSFIAQVTDMLFMLSGSRFYWGPYGGASTVVQGVVFYPLLGTLGILIPDSSPRAYGGVEHSFRGLRTSDCGQFLTNFCFRALSGGCAQVHLAV